MLLCEKLSSRNHVGWRSEALQTKEEEPVDGGRISVSIESLHGEGLKLIDLVAPSLPAAVVLRC